MDFSQFLKNSYSQKNTQKSNNIDKKQNQKNSKNKIKTDSTEKSLSKSQYYVSNSKLDIYKNLRKGNMVKIIRLENSEFNYYKGYIGEVRDYKKNQNHASIFLHARNNNIIISFPLTHFELL